MKLFTFLIQACLLNASLILSYSIFKEKVSPQHQFEVGDCIEYFFVVQIWDGNGRVVSVPNPTMTGHTAKILEINGNNYTIEHRDQIYKEIRAIDEMDNSYAKINCDGRYP